MVFFLPPTLSPYNPVNISKKFILLSFIFAWSCLPVFAQTSIPLADFLKESDFNEPKLSPDGTKLAVVARWKDRKALALIDLKTKQPQILTAPETFDVADVQWIGNSRLLFSGVEESSFGVAKGRNGGLFAIDVDGKNTRTLCASHGFKGDRKAAPGYYFGRLGDSTSEVLVVNNQRLMTEPDVFRMNVQTGAKREVVRNPGAVRGFVADHTGVVRIAYKQTGLTRSLLYRGNASEEWHEIKKWQFLDGEMIPLEFDKDNKLLYVSTNLDGDTRALCLLDPATGEIVSKLYSNETYDMETVILDPNTHELMGYYYEGARPTYVWVSEYMRKMQALIDQEIPEGINQFYSWSRDYTWCVIYNYSDRNPGVFYLFNTKEMTLEKIITMKEWINRDQMAEMRPISYKARDGMAIHGYLTLPPGKALKNLPLIVNPHGGPWARDSWGFNFEVQFLASRGYAVLQMDFRASVGYGKKHEQAGYGQWGLTMQDDITDAVRWVIEQGYIDPKRVAIYGGSYGGYATMAGLAFTPELYRCGINYVGVTDVRLLVKTIPEHWEPQRKEMEIKVGYNKGEPSRLDAVSTIENSDKIKAPVFFAYGELDERVDLKHATKVISRLKSNGVFVEYMVKNNEGHGYRGTKNQVDFYSTMERFLAKYMNPEYKTSVNIGQEKVLEMPVKK